MKVDLKQLIAGPDGVYSPGPAELPEELALALIKGGYAKSLEPKSVEVPRIERAEITAPETADLRRKGRKRGNETN